MPQPPNKLSQFWQELKRRKVIKVIAMYAATAFIIMEAGDIMLPRLGLPDWTVTFIIILLIIGFPIAIILSWIFDVTPEGIKKTEPAEADKEKEVETKPDKRKLKASDVIIAVLLVIVVILAYPKIFKKDKFASLRDEDGRISIAVMPFQNMTNDTLWDVYQDIIQDVLITNLSNSDELSVRQYQTMLDIFQSTEHTNYASITTSVASDISRKLQANTFIDGSIKSAGGKVYINAHLSEAETEEIYRTFQIDGNTEEDIIKLADSLSKLVRNYLEIKILEQDADFEMRKWAKTNSAEAYKYFTKGYKLFIELDHSSAVDFYNKALEIDTNFTYARIWLSIAFANLGMHEEEKLCIQKAYEQIENISYTEQLFLKSLKSESDKDKHAFIEYNRRLLENDPQARIAWWQQGGNYYQIHNYEKAIQCLEKALEIDSQWGGGWKWSRAYHLPGLVYHELGNHKREKEIYELGLSVLPDNHRIIFRQAVCALSQGDTKEANDFIEKYSLIRKAEGSGDYLINLGIGTIYQQADQYDKAIEIFKSLVTEDPRDPWSKSELGFILIDNEIDIEEGMEFINQALKFEPDNGYLLYTKGLGYYKQGKVKEAHEILKKAWDLRPRYHHEHYLLLREIEQALDSQNQ
jgi:tetratricopeptide (TPR) repeat protein